MGNRLLVEVLDYAPTTLTHREKLFLAVLAKDARDETRQTWNSVEAPEILRRAQLSRTQVYEVLKALTGKGCVKRLSAGQKHSTAKYAILPLGPQCPEERDADPSQCPESPDTEGQVQCQGNRDTDGSQCQENRDPEPQLQGPGNRDTDPSQCQGNRDADDSQCPENRDAYSTTRERNTSLSRQALEGAFAAFWREYPRKVGKQDAAKAFAAALRSGAQAEHITAAIVRHRAHWQAENRQTNFIPHPATWLRRGSYDDELHTPQQPIQQMRWADPAERGIF